LVPDATAILIYVAAMVQTVCVVRRTALPAHLYLLVLLALMAPVGHALALIVLVRTPSIQQLVRLIRPVVVLVLDATVLDPFVVVKVHNVPT